ncbi:hypothetical protein [Streptomyces sp. NPDC004658]|uniref:hypothetical protein n=1 Tax=Streptomyces sp. NPDC004658 TaxID=3154672 RepID=UPI0033A89C7E
MDALHPTSHPLPVARPAAEHASAPAGADELSVVSLRRPSTETTALFTICLRDEHPAGA